MTKQYKTLLLSFFSVLCFNMGMISLCQAMSSITQPILLQAKQCMQKANSTIAISDCIQQEHAAWNRELNIAYTKLMAASKTAAAQNALRDAQRQWITFRDQEDKFLHHFYDQQGGTIWSNVFSRMQINVIKNRVQELYAILDSLDMSRSADD